MQQPHRGPAQVGSSWDPAPTPPLPMCRSRLLCRREGSRAFLGMIHSTEQPPSQQPPLIWEETLPGFHMSVTVAVLAGMSLNVSAAPHPAGVRGLHPLPEVARNPMWSDKPATSKCFARKATAWSAP